MLGRNYIAIDIGNGEIKAAACDATGRPFVIRTERGGKSWPSVVFQTSDGKHLVGEDAREQAIVFPAQAAVNWKSQLSDKTKRYFNGKASASDIVAIVVLIIVAQAEKQLGTKVDGVFVTCPANFNDAMKQGLLEGFTKAGVTVIQLLTEPAAAAFAYAQELRSAAGETTHIMCFDLGHGTFDVTVLEVKDGVAIPIATEGIAELGGRDFGNLIRELLLRKISQATSKTITVDKLSAQQNWELDEKVTKAKHALSGQTSTSVALTFGGKPQLVEITQAEYQALYAPLVQRMHECAEKALKSVNMNYKDMHALVIAGGAYNSPRLQEDAANRTGLAPKTDIDLTSTVSFGAATAADQKAREDGGFGVLPDRPRLQEASGHDIGVCVIDTSSGSPLAVCSVVIPKNTPLTQTHSELYRLEREHQAEALIDILQGPNGSSENKCLKIGSIRLVSLPPDPSRSRRIKVDFKFDVNGICVVTATDKISGKTQTISVKIKDEKKAA